MALSPPLTGLALPPAAALPLGAASAQATDCGAAGWAWAPVPPPLVEALPPLLPPVLPGRELLLPARAPAG